MIFKESLRNVAVSICTARMDSETLFCLAEQYRKATEIAERADAYIGTQAAQISFDFAEASIESLELQIAKAKEQSR